MLVALDKVPKVLHNVAKYLNYGFHFEDADKTATDEENEEAPVQQVESEATNCCEKQKCQEVLDLH